MIRGLKIQSWAFARRAPFVAIALSCQACAFNYTDTAGNRHTIGVVDITTHAAAAPETFAGDVIDVASLGLTAGRNAQGGYITLGYSHEISVALRQDALVRGNPLDPGHQTNE